MEAYYKESVPAKPVSCRNTGSAGKQTKSSSYGNIWFDIKLLESRSTSLVTNSLVKPFGSQSLYTATSFMTEILLIYSFSYFSPTILCWNSTKPDRYFGRVFSLSYFVLFLVHSWYCPLRSISPTSCESTGIRSKQMPAKARSSYSWKSEPTVGNRWFSSAHCSACLLYTSDAADD